MKAKRLKKNENIKSKIIIRVSIIILLIILVIVGIMLYINYCKTTGTSIIFQKYSLQQKNPENISEELIKEKVFQEMKITDIEIKKEDGIIYFSANIKNETDQNFEGRNVKIKFVDENNKPIANFKTKIEEIKPNEAINMQISTSMDIMNAYNFIKF